MASSVGSLLVSLGLNAASFTSGLTKAEYQAQQFARNTRRAIADVAGALASLEIGRTLLENTKSIISEAAALNDLSDATGSSVESLSRLNNQAKISGADFATLEAALLKLSSNMSGFDEDSNRAKETLKKLGITTKDPVQAMQEFAAKLNTYADGINKVGLAAAVFSEKMGPKFVATLKDIAELQDVGATVSKKQAEEAEALGKAFNRLGTEATGFRNAVLSDLVPALIELITQFNLAYRAAGTFGQGLEAVLNMQLRGGGPEEQLAKVNAEIERLKKTLAKDFGPLKGLQALNEFIHGEELANLFIQREVLEKQIAKANKPADRPKPPPPPPPPKGTDKTAKKLLDQQIKDLDNFIRAEQDTFQDREKFLQIYYQDDLIGLRDYFSGRQAALAEAGEKEGKAIDAQIAAFAKAAAKGAKPEDRIEAETKLAEAIAKKARLQQTVTTRGIELTLEENRAVKQLTDSVEQASIALAEMRGDTVTAALAGFDFANRKFAAQLAALKQSPRPEDQNLAGIGERDLAATRALVGLRAELNKATENYSMTLEEMGIAQARIQIAEETGAISSMAAYEQRQALSKQYVAQLNSEVVAMEAIAAASGKREDIIRAMQARLRVEQEAAKALVEEQRVLKDFANQISESFSSSFEGFIRGTKSAKDAFKDFVGDIESMLVKLALKKLMDQILGINSSNGPDIFSLFGKLLGSFGGAGAGGGIGYGSAGSAIPIGPYPYASGTDWHPGGLAMVGENGPEIVNLPRGSQVWPHGSGPDMGGVSIGAMNFHVQGQVNSSSVRQIRNAARDGVMAAVRDR